MILHTSLKYISVNIVCLIFFHDLTSPPVQLLRIFWLYILVIVFMKFDVKSILWPTLIFASFLIFFAWIFSSVFGYFPAFKLIFIEILVIVYFGVNQCYQITKILNAYKKEKNSRL